MSTFNTESLDLSDLDLGPQDPGACIEFVAAFGTPSRAHHDSTADAIREAIGDVWNAYAHFHQHEPTSVLYCGPVGDDEPLDIASASMRFRIELEDADDEDSDARVVVDCLDPWAEVVIGSIVEASR